MCELAANLWGRTGFAFILALCFLAIMQIWSSWLQLFRHTFEYLSGCCWLVTYWARCSVACALPGSLRFGSAATEGGAVSDLFASLLRWRSAHGIWTVATRVHPPAGGKEEREKVFPALSLIACILLIKCKKYVLRMSRGDSHLILKRVTIFCDTLLLGVAMFLASLVIITPAQHQHHFQ